MKIVEVGPVDVRRNNHGVLWALPCSLALWLVQWLHEPHAKTVSKRGGGSILEESQKIILSNDQLIVLPLNVTAQYRATQL